MYNFVGAPLLWTTRFLRCRCRTKSIYIFSTSIPYWIDLAFARPDHESEAALKRSVLAVVSFQFHHLSSHVHHLNWLRSQARLSSRYFLREATKSSVRLAAAPFSGERQLVRGFFFKFVLSGIKNNFCALH